MATQCPRLVLAVVRVGCMKNNGLPFVSKRHVSCAALLLQMVFLLVFVFLGERGERDRRVGAVEFKSRLWWEPRTKFCIKSAVRLRVMIHHRRHTFSTVILNTVSMAAA